MSRHRRPADATPRPRSTGRARRGLDLSLKAMGDGGLREPVDEAFVALARIAADELDEAVADPRESRFVRGRLLANALGTYKVLLGRVPSEDRGPSLEELFNQARALDEA